MIGLLDLLLGGGAANSATSDQERIARLRLGGEDTPAGGGSGPASSGGGILGILRGQPSSHGILAQRARAALEPSNPRSTAPQVSRGAPISSMPPQNAGTGLPGLLGRLFGVEGDRGANYNGTVQWLQNRGYSPEASEVIAGDRDMLNRAIVGSGSPGEPSQYQQRQQALVQAGIDPRSAEGREYFLTGKLGGADAQLTDDEREFERAKREGYQGSFTDWQTKGVREQGADFGRYQDVRKEIQGLPSYKNYAQAAPIYKTMLDASKRDTKAADLNLVYGLGKIFDPGSVVREGEMVMVKDTASLPDWLIGSIQSLNGGARLQPETRAAILAEARSRIGSYRDLLDTDMTQYRELATQFKLDPKFLLPPMEDIQEPPALARFPQPDSGGQTPSQTGRRTKSGVEWRLDQ